LHTRGYDFFNLPKLTNQEVNILLEAYNIKAKADKKAADKAKRDANRNKNRRR